MISPVALADFEIGTRPLTQDQRDGVIQLIALAQHLGQVLTVVRDGELVAFVAWLRCNPLDLGHFQAHDRHALRPLTLRDLQRGPVAVIVELATTGDPSGFTLVRYVSRLPGVEYLAGWRGERFRFQRLKRKGSAHGLWWEYKQEQESAG